MKCKNIQKVANMKMKSENNKNKSNNWMCNKQAKITVKQKNNKNGDMVVQQQEINPMEPLQMC